ncbi:helix-turn-helix transcriptional regulator [Simiduia curdlanivorans]|uniref:Helix-turn-helix domain-containing protein n=1 Tax=Simiduia curdlanivorans TaxID=1492769 RepID=A0ABV8V9Z6_9GAMM|nr:helix-turn-helix transcriptional regulator [Simiduia curdlanivorans]MDN3639338.1 helix-turn-helix transcriptional regulator [Simiduia curdlanivorans]
MNNNTHPKAFGRFLRFWRGVHQLSQEELADRLGSSPRHISRLENHASTPSETLVEEIAKSLSLGERDRNHLRIAAGYYVQETAVDYSDAKLRWLRKAMGLTLKALNPFPTALTDSTGKILMVNQAWVNFYQSRIGASDLEKVTNLYDFLFTQMGDGALLTGWQDTISMILMALKQNAMLTNSDKDLATFERYLTHKNVPADWPQRAAKLEPMASYRVQIDYAGKLQRFYNVSQTVGALGPAAYLAEPRLTVSTLYPEDDNLDLSGLLDATATHPLLP